jgi:hypothetical protein
MNARGRTVAQAIRAVGLLALATMCMGMDQFGTEAVGCFRACQYAAKHPDALKRSEEPKPPPPKEAPKGPAR